MQILFHVEYLKIQFSVVYILCVSRLMCLIIQIAQEKKRGLADRKAL